MAHRIDPGAAWGKWQEWARLFVSEINRLNETVEEIRASAIARIGEVYARVENRHDAAHALVTESEARLRLELQRMEHIVGVAGEATVEDIKDIKATIHTIGLDIMELKTKCALWGVLAGSVPALAVVLFESLRK